jgi:2'-5' RNA ligase
MGLLRAFLAAELPPNLQDAIQTATASVRRSLGADLVRWVPAHNVHLTLKFLGDVSPASLDLIKHMLETEAGNHEPFDATIEGFGCYPSARRPRILWVGLEAPPSLSSLHHDLNAAAARLGYPAEDRDFSPHLTIGRVRQNATATELQKIRAEVEHLQLGNLGTTRVESIHLFKSDLLPTGSVYTRLFTAQLGIA